MRNKLHFLQLFFMPFSQAQKYDLKTGPSHKLPVSIQPEPPTKKPKVIEVDYSKESVTTESELGRIISLSLTF